MGGAFGGYVGLSYFGMIGGIPGGLIGLFIGHVIGVLLDRRSTHLFFRKISRSSDEELWRIVNLGFWNLYQTMALLNLAARGQDVSGQLPRIIGMLESDNRETRLFGWDALRIVFCTEYKIIENYDPRSTTEECRKQVETLKASIEKMQNIPSNPITDSGVNTESE